MPNINKAYQWAINTCNAAKVGYNQSYRNQQTVNGITYYDCSSFINYAILAGGWSTPSYAPSHNAWTTYSMGSALTSLGFKHYTVGSSFQWKAGDIGVSSSHTEMVYKGGTGSAVFMGAHGRNGITLTNQVSIGSSSGNTSYTRTFPNCYRWTGGTVTEDNDGEDATGYGYSAYVVAALAGNAYRESHINPGQEQIGGGGGYGMWQWTGSRRTALESWCSTNGYSTTDGDAQCQYLIDENDWIDNTGNYSNLQEFLNSTSTDLNQLVADFLACWERAGVAALSERQEFAQKALDYINEHAQDTSITGWIVDTSSMLTEAQALNNAVMMYRFFSTGGAGGTLSSAKRKKMPVWMYIPPTREYR